MRRTPSAWSSSPSWTLKGFRRLRGAHTAGLCPAPGPARAAPKGLAPLESLPSPAGGTGILGCCPSFVPCDATRQNGGGLRRRSAKDGCSPGHSSEHTKAAGMITPAALNCPPLVIQYTILSNKREAIQFLLNFLCAGIFTLISFRCHAFTENPVIG